MRLRRTFLAVIVASVATLSACESSNSAGTCTTPPTVSVSVAGRPSVQLSGTYTAAPVNVVARVGDAITFRFVGVCLGGAHLAANDPAQTAGVGFTDLAQVGPTQVWTPAKPGVRLLAAEWSCSGPITCPLAILGVVRVTTPSAALPVVDECGMGHFTVRPVALTLACADAGLIVHSLIWSTWTSASAEATGIASLNDCVPYCAAGHTHEYSARLVLSAATRGRPSFFTLATMTFTGRRPTGWTNPTISYPVPAG